MKKNIIKNTVVGFGSQIIILILGLIVPRIIMTHYGSDTNGLINTITQIFTYMALLEAGISQASRNALYKYIVKDDRDGISLIMSASRRYYRKISYIYLAAVVALSFVVPFILKTEIDYWTIFFFVIFEGLTSVIAFYFVNTWTAFLTASGKSYITNSLTLLSKVLGYGVRIALALFNINIAFIQVGYFAVSLIQLSIYYVYIHKKYGWIDYKAAPKDYKLADRNSYIVTELAMTVFSSTDMIILSIFVSTALSSVYSTYTMVFGALSTLLNSIYSAINYNLGQAYSENIERYKHLHDMFHSFFMSCITILMCVAYILILPFIRLYTEGVTDINYIDSRLPIFFCLVQMLSWSRWVPGNLTGIAGYAKQTSYISLVEAGINIVVSLILVRPLGILGVLIGTVAALPIKAVYCNWLADRKIMKRSPSKTILMFIINYAVFSATVALCLFWQVSIANYLEFVLWGFGLFVVYCIVVFGLNAIVNKDLLRLPKMLLRKGA